MKPDPTRMTAEQFNAALIKLGFPMSGLASDLGQSECARFFGHAARQVRAWALGDVRVPPGVSIALNLMLKLNVNRDKAVKLLGLARE
jgi:hypothetical protein